MDENPYKAPNEERHSESGFRRGLLEMLAVSIVWAFNAVIVGFILYVIVFAVMGILNGFAAK